ncbi:FAD-dependent oxidoreductase [Rhodovulum sp. DZ06]|uniref:FAD-dependent oxidoreductase n=1 Tax=Rhodovulum sp. DZ06 TaxID=3425126 RepID=UPI003D335A65
MHMQAVPSAQDPFDWTAPPASRAARFDAVVIGGGPAGFKAAQELTRRGRSVALLNAEGWAPYNRVKLTPLLAGEVQIGQVMQPRDPEGDGLGRHYVGARVVEIDRDLRMARTAGGRWFAYRDLLICTGSRAFIPAIPGVEARHVYTFRNVDDAQALRARSRQARAVAVIGGGLLGLEAARAMAAHGAAVTVIEHEPRLMPRQLDPAAAAMLADQLAALGVAARCGVRVEKIVAPFGAVDGLLLSDGRMLDADTVVICTGLRPNKELGAAAGLAHGRAIKVDARMRTSDPHVFAAGECAEMDGRIEGLVGPCLAQAEAAVRAICGEDGPYAPPAPSTRLKVVGAEVFSVGDIEALEAAPGVRDAVWRNEAEGLYRRIFVVRGRIAGAIGVGAWPEAHRVQQAVALRRPPPPMGRWRFTRHGCLWPESAPASAAALPAAATICNCTGVTRGRIGEAVARGADSVEAIQAETGAGAVCGSCRPRIEEILSGAAAPRAIRMWKPLVWASTAALALALLSLLAPRIPLPGGYAPGSWAETLWRDDIAKQWTGYTLLALSAALGLLGLRKRIGVLKRLGGYDWWRIVHLGLGAAAALGLAVHTGFRLGHGLNMWLMLAMLAAMVFGAAAGLATGGAHKLREAGVQGERPRTIPLWLHILALWPLPALLAAHVLAVYAY